MSIQSITALVGTFVIAFGLTALLVPPVQRLCERRGWLQLPGGRFMEPCIPRPFQLRGHGGHGMEGSGRSLNESAERADTFDYQAHSARIYSCLEQLDPARRNCILHAYVDGYSHSEIAHKLGTPLGTVKAWIKRSLAALRECMA